MRMHLASLVGVLAMHTLAPEASANPSSVVVSKDDDDDQAQLAAYNDDLKTLLDDEARLAQASGNYERAWLMFEHLLALDPNDAEALRESGRSAAAMGDYGRAEAALGRYMALRGEQLDPEIHFIRGEVLLGIGRPTEGLRELQIAEEQLAIAPKTQQVWLWQARIHMLRKEPSKAISTCKKLIASDPSEANSREVVMLLAEAYIMAGQNEEARHVLNSHLAVETDERAEEMLAWVLELERDIDDEVVVRKNMSYRWDGSAAPALVGYARSLERAQRYRDALESYREAHNRGNEAVGSDIVRLEGALAPEVMVSGDLSDFPTGLVSGLRVGGMIPIRPRVHLSAIVERESLVDEQEATALTSASLWSMLRFGDHQEMGLGATGWHDARSQSRIGASAVGFTNPARPLRLVGLADYNVPWKESASTIREGGSRSDLALHLYGDAWSPRFVLMAGGRARLLEFSEVLEQPKQTAREYMGTAGLDWVALANYENVVRGNSLDQSLLRSAQFGDSLVFSYRHYEVSTSGELSPRLVLVSRSRIDELSATARKIVDNGGTLAIGAAGGIGYDSARSTRLWRASGELLLALTGKMRLTIASEVARESRTGLQGKRLTGYVGFHADL